MIACFFLAQAGIIIGDLDRVAPIISMCFLACYAIICLACRLDRWAGNPSFRPQIRVPSWVSLVGAAACFAVMFKIDMVAMIAALLLMGIVYVLLQRRQLRLRSGDTWEGVWSELARRALLRLHRIEQDPRNWRPNVMVFAGHPKDRPHLIHFGEWLVRESGILTNHMLVEGSLSKDRDRASELHLEADSFLAQQFPSVLFRHMVCRDIYAGMKSVAKAAGLAGLLPNTVLLGWGRKTKDPVAYAEALGDVVALNHNLLILAHDEARGFNRNERIDVWWGGLERNWQLMVILASLLQGSDEWEKAKVRLMFVARTEDEEVRAKQQLGQVLQDAKLRAETRVLRIEDENESPFDVIHRESRSADLTIMGLKEPDRGEGETFIERIDGILKGLGTTLLVRASSRFEGSRVLFEESD